MSLELMWARARPFLEAALEHAHGTHLIEDVMKQVLEGKLQLWVGDRSAAISEVLHFPRVRAVNVFLAGGEMAELRACLPGIEAWARGMGCSRIMWAGRLDLVDGRRSGWERLMPDFEPEHVSLSKELT